METHLGKNEASAHTVVAECYAMNAVYDHKLDGYEKSRIEKLEVFDEFEEWVLL